jgi:nucleoside-diphosphate-sugar epimerase
MNILITGSNGFIGKHLANKLTSNHKVIGHGKIRNNNSAVSDFFKIDINSQSDWQVCLQNVNTIIHLAAAAHNNLNDSEYLNEVNNKGTVNLARQAVKSGVSRFIFISTIGVHGNSSTKPFDEKSKANPHSPYSESKLQAELELLKISRETGLEVVIIRPVLVYGRGATGNFAKLLNLVKKVPILPFALSKNKRSFISVDNLVDFIILCTEHPAAANEIFCISDGIDFSIKDFTNGIASGLSKQLIQLPVPLSVFKILGAITGKQNQINQLIGDLQVDSSKAEKLLGWSPPTTMSKTFSNLAKPE